ncbi:MAG: AmmeMemoRadiSam system protein B [Candidatus Methylomirabilales bacterium]
MIRRPAVAGTFYPESPRVLRVQVEELLGPRKEGTAAVAVVAPHAGYLYSGRVAGAVFGAVRAPETSVILGPNHTGLGAGAAILTGGTFATPLGEVAIDTDLGRAIRDRSRILQEDDEAHRREHAIEVELPFLQILAPRAPFVPICLLSSEYGVCQEVGRAVGEAVQASGKRVLLIASTDMSHYCSREEAAVKDRMAIEAIIALDPERLYETVRRERVTMCGFHATTTVLVAARVLGATRAELVGYATSAEVTKDDASVVGYAGLIIQ